MTNTTAQYIAELEAENKAYKVWAWDAARQTQLNKIAQLKRVIREYQVWWIDRFGDIEPDCPKLAQLFKAAKE